MLALRYRGEPNGSSRHFGKVFAHAPAGPVLSNCAEEYRVPWSAEHHDSHCGHQWHLFGDDFAAMFGHGPDPLAAPRPSLVHPDHLVHLVHLVHPGHPGHADRPYHAAAPSGEALALARAAQRE
jgi:hypothetical protein